MSSDLGGKPHSEPQTEVHNMPKSDKDTETKENVNIESGENMPDSEKSKSLPEPLRVGKGMPRLPPIGMAELTSILQGPNMPSQKLMKEVTEKIRIKNDESGSDDGSVSGGGGVGIAGILDCILEVSLFHQDSEDESDEEGDEIFVRELPCKFCKKIFGSTMNLQTHVLMTHSQEDPSVLNINNPSCGGGGRREKISLLGRSKSIEGKDKDTVHRTRKRYSAGQQECNIVRKEEKSHKRVRSRHSSREQSCKLSGKGEDKSVDLSEASSVSSQNKTLRKKIQGKDISQKCDLESSVVSPTKSPEQSSHSHSLPDDSPSPSKSKATKRNLSTSSSSTTPDSSSFIKKTKRSQCKSGETNVSVTQPRRSLRKK